MAKALRGQDPKTAKPSKPKILIFGRPGVGKTWASIDFPSVYYIDTEGGANLGHYTDKLKAAGGAYLGPADGANDFSVVTDEIITLATTPHKFRTLVIDSYSKLFNTQVSTDFERMEKNGRDMEKTFGAEKKPAINSTRRWLRWFEKLDMNVILICHEKDVYRDGKITGVSFDGWDKLEYELHLALQVTKVGAARKARVTKSRLEQFTEGTLFDWSFVNFATKYGKDIIEAASIPVAVATPEQVERLDALLKIVKVGPDIVAKWLDKAGAENFGEMTAEQVSACIKYVESQLPKAA